MIDLSEIKKLPDTEKVKIIDEILESMDDLPDGDDTSDESYDLEVANLLNERLAAYNRGETKSYTWDEVKERLRVARSKIHNLNND